MVTRSERYFRHMLEAALEMRHGLRALDLVEAGDPIIVLLPRAAGIRFEVALTSMRETLLPQAMDPANRAGPVDGDITLREATIGHITFRWPVDLMALPDGGAAQEGTAREIALRATMMSGLG